MGASACYKSGVLRLGCRLPVDPSLKQALHSTRWRIAAVAALVAIAVIFFLGGFRQAPPKRTPQAGIGERVVSGALAVRALRAWVDTKDPRGYTDSYLGKHFLVLEAEVENLTTTSSDFYLNQDLRWLSSMDDQSGAQLDLAYLADDMSPLDKLHPAMLSHVFIVWKIPSDQPLVQPFRFGLYRREYVKKAYVNNESGWIQGGPGVTLKIEAEDRRGGDKP